VEVPVAHSSAPELTADQEGVVLTTWGIKTQALPLGLDMVTTAELETIVQALLVGEAALGLLALPVVVPPLGMAALEDRLVLMMGLACPMQEAVAAVDPPPDPPPDLVMTEAVLVELPGMALTELQTEAAVAAAVKAA